MSWTLLLWSEGEQKLIFDHLVCRLSPELQGDLSSLGNEYRWEIDKEDTYGRVFIF